MSEKLKDSVEKAVKATSTSKENLQVKPILKKPITSSYSKINMNEPKCFMEKKDIQ